ncbi:hypothetical protein [Candidatus Uabimicrobium sp. HlEnr_7]|uniref:hypothetical protein n=1 Tax=Candidatus Uabimicrobium helgolandensis TaxID=3095367 RepID=UPI0035593572
MRFFLLLLIALSFVHAQHRVYLRQSNTIPLYSQQTDYWCGAATTQMLLRGYPNGKEHAFDQTHVWDTIQKYKVETGWASDPEGMKGALNNLADSHVGGFWQIFWWKKGYNPGPNLMYWIARGMTELKFPAHATVYGHGHALVVTGLTTSKNPVNVPSGPINLINIEVHNPWPPNKGEKVYMTGSHWYSRYFYPPNSPSNSKWSECMLATVHIAKNSNAFKEELPITQGPVLVAPKLQKQGEVISTAVAKLKMHEVLKGKIRESDQQILGGLTMLQPILVNKNHQGYYLIPFGNVRTNESSAAIILNAYTGDFEAMSVFGKPFFYLNEREYRVKNINIEAVFSPSKECRSPFTPLWKSVSSFDEAVYYDYEGNIVTLEKLTREN